MVTRLATGRSLPSSLAARVYSEGLMVAVLTVAMPMVYPSGAAWAMLSVPIRPPAPALLSTTTGWPSVLRRPSAITRATMSVEPPAAKGTMSLTGLLG